MVAVVGRDRWRKLKLMEFVKCQGVIIITIRTTIFSSGSACQGSVVSPRSSGCGLASKTASHMYSAVQWFTYAHMLFSVPVLGCFNCSCHVHEPPCSPCCLLYMATCYHTQRDSAWAWYGRLGSLRLHHSKAVGTSRSLCGTCALAAALLCGLFVCPCLDFLLLYLDM